MDSADAPHDVESVGSYETAEIHRYGLRRFAELIATDGARGSAGQQVASRITADATTVKFVAVGQLCIDIDMRHAVEDVRLTRCVKVVRTCGRNIRGG